MKLQTALIPALLALLLGCASGPPTEEELADADYGLRPDPGWAVATAKSWIAPRLRNSEGARFGSGELEKGWFKAIRSDENRFGWRLPTVVNVKNAIGGYTGDNPWVFYFRGNRLVGVGEPRTRVGSFGASSHLLYQELPGADGSLDDAPPQ
ncbi:MAG: hypothetical protein AAF682_23530 [Planctomycetota bacterium]